jgi:hypothetical protein
MLTATVINVIASFEVGTTAVALRSISWILLPIFGFSNTSRTCKQLPSSDLPNFILLSTGQVNSPIFNTRSLSPNNPYLFKIGQQLSITTLDYYPPSTMSSPYHSALSAFSEAEDDRTPRPVSPKSINTKFSYDAEEPSSPTPISTIPPQNIYKKINLGKSKITRECTPIHAPTHCSRKIQAVNVFTRRSPPIRTPSAEQLGLDTFPDP